MPRIVLSLLLALAAALPAAAQTWPVRPVRVILSQPPGSSPDILARLLGERLSRQWGQGVVVENRPGGQNVVGAQAAARATPDGYTFYYATTAALVVNVYTFKSLPYDPRKDFVPVTMIGLSPFVLAVNPSVPARTLAELVAWAKANPDAQCLPMGFLQFHQQPQPRMIIQTEKMILIEYEANYGLRHIYMDGRKLPPQGEPQPFWYGYSVGHWEGNDLVVETNNLRGADEDSPYDGWLDVNGSPYSRQAKITERFRRPTLGHLQIDFTVEDPKSYTKPWTVRIDQRLLPDQELIEFVCNENQQFGNRIQLD